MDIDRSKAQVFMTLEGTSSTDECGEACSISLACKLAAFIESTKNCELLKGRASLQNRESKTVLLATCDYGCFKVGQTYKGTGTNLGTTHSANLCQALCQASSQCSAFSWNSGSKACSSYSGTPDLVSKENSVSGVKASCKPNTKSTDYAGSCEMARR